ncbi:MULTISPECIES: hypothetical protein [Methylosinus]|nr:MULTISPECIES: hypothetical protein [Methylosinus]
MSKVLFIDTKTELTLAPGATVHGWWNNASPFNAVWDAQAVPFATGSTATGFNQDTSLEVTRVWRHFTVTEIKPNPQSQTVDTKDETEIHYEIKNIGNSVAKFHVVLSAIYE